MAFWQRKRGKDVYVYVSKNGKQTPLSRDLTRHLDNEPDHNIDYWVQEYTRNFEKPQREITQIVDPILARLVESYCSYMVSRRKKSPKTAADHERMLLTYILPYFHNSKKMDDPNQWWKASAGLADYLLEQGQSEFQVARANSALRGFWDYLQKKERVLNGLELKVEPAIREDSETPLPRRVSPEEVLEFARGAEPRYALLAILGYFFSLRPQESLALRVCDFLAGTEATFLQCCQTMNRYKLFDRLAVRIERQKTQDGTMEEPKAYSKGWVACFSEAAAQLLVELTKDLDPEALLFDHQNDWNLKLWRRNGIPGITLKDLRRASSLYLGHEGGFEFVALNKHCRHKKPETTMLYLRRPEEKVLRPGKKLDLGA